MIGGRGRVCVNPPGECGKSGDLGLGGNPEVAEMNPEGRSRGSKSLVANPVGIQVRGRVLRL